MQVRYRIWLSAETNEHIAFTGLLLTHLLSKGKQRSNVWKIVTFKAVLGLYSHPDQCRIKNSSKCSNCYGPRAFGGSAVFSNKCYLLHYIEDFFNLRSQYFATFAISSKRRFSIEHCLCPEILFLFFFYSYAQNRRQKAFSFRLARCAWHFEIC